MSIVSATNRNDYVGNGATSVYTYGFRIFHKSHIKVVVLNPASPPEVTLTEGANYTVQNVGEKNGGTITLLGAYANLTTGYKLALILWPPLTQDADIKDNDVYFRSSQEADHDRRVQQILRLTDELSRSMKLPFSEAGSESLTKIPDLESRKGKVYGWDSTTGAPTPMANVPTSGVASSAFMNTVLDDVDAPTARATLGASDFDVAIVSPGSIGADQNNYAGFGTSKRWILGRATASAHYKITGISDGGTVKMLTIVNIGSNAITLVHQSGSSAEANRMILDGSANLTLYQNDRVTLWYDTTSSRWRQLA